MTQINIGTGYKIDGFVAENVKAGEKAKMIVKRSLVSDEPEFYKYIEQISNMFISKIGNPTYISSFIVLVHKDTSADVYIGDLEIILNINPKRDFKKGEAIYKKDIADIKELKFKNIKIEETDKFICCLKVGWKFGLFFDFNYTKKLNIEDIYSELGSLYRYLDFQYIYNILESKNKFDEILRDGWFPFIELIGSDDRVLLDLYENKKFDYDNRINSLVQGFNRERIIRISDK